MKNTGLNIALEQQHQSETDYLFSAESPVCMATIPVGERLKYLPIGQIQRGREDWQSCASIGLVENIETKLTYLVRNNLLHQSTIKWLKDVGFIVMRDGLLYVEISDRWVAINSGTTRQGNSLIAPWKYTFGNDVGKGLIPKSMLPSLPEMSWDEYHDPDCRTQEMYDIGAEFNKRIHIIYERIELSMFREAREKDIATAAAWAWPMPNKQGVYERREGMVPNHVFLDVEPDIIIRDSYTDTFDGDFNKHLAPDYEFLPYKYRAAITGETVIEEFDDPIETGGDWTDDMFANFVQGIIDFLKIFFKFIIGKK